MRPVVIRAGGRSAQRLLLTGCLILGVLGLDAVDAHAAAPSSLTGETFISHLVKGSTLTGTCPEDFNGTNGSFNFSVSGTAAGPFPGIFTESGSFTTSPTGEVGDFSSTFTIENAAGSVTVTGTKSLHPESNSDSVMLSRDRWLGGQRLRRRHLSRHDCRRRAGYGHRDRQHR